MNKYLDKFICRGLLTYCEEGPILTLRKQIQDDPMVVRELGMRINKLRKLFNHFAVRGMFSFESSCVKLFEMQEIVPTASTSEDHFWYPLSP